MRRCALQVNEGCAGIAEAHDNGFILVNLLESPQEIPQRLGQLLFHFQFRCAGVNAYYKSDGHRHLRKFVLRNPPQRHHARYHHGGDEQEGDTLMSDGRSHHFVAFFLVA